MVTDENDGGNSTASTGGRVLRSIQEKKENRISTDETNQ